MTYAPKARLTVSFTYSIVTPDSAEQGDWAEHGWYMPGGRFDALKDAECRHEATLEAAKRGEYDHLVTGAGALQLIRNELGCLDDVQAYGDHLSASEADARQDYATGEHTRLTVHVRGNPRLIRALARVLGRD